jgi:hypothetical protein
MLTTGAQPFYELDYATRFLPRRLSSRPKITELIFTFGFGIQTRIQVLCCIYEKVKLAIS